MLKAVLFDMDGVIIDSEPQHARAAVLTLEKYNVNIPVDYAYSFIGTTTYHMCKKIIEEFSIPITPEELLKGMEETKERLRQAEGYIVIPYIIELMKDLKSHGIKMIIASSSSAASIRDVMKSLRIDDIFQEYISGTDVSLPKPAPDIFVAAARLLGVEPKECLVIEDSYNGVTAAAAADMVSIGYLNPNSGNQDLSQAAILVEGFDEINYDFINTVYQHAHLLPATILTTERLFLRELTTEDCPSLCSICSQPGIREHLPEFSDDPVLEQLKVKAYIKNIYHFYGFGLWGIFLRNNNQLIGRCGIEYKTLDQRAVYELGYFIDPDYQHKGYAMEAVTGTLQYCFQTLKLDQVVAIIEEGNLQSERLALRAGMQRTGVTLRNQRRCFVYEIKRSAGVSLWKVKEIPDKNN